MSNDVNKGLRGSQGDPGIKGQHGEPGAQGIHGHDGTVGDRGAKGATGDTGATGAVGQRGGRGKSGFDWTPMVAYLLLAAAFIFTARENRVQTQDILKQRTALETCVNNLRSDLRFVFQDFSRGEPDQGTFQRSIARLENRQC